MQSRGYANWAKKFNLKLVAETVNYLTENNILEIDALDKRISELSDTVNNKKERLKTAEKRIKVLEEQIRDIDVYRKTKPVVEGVPKHFGKQNVFYHDYKINLCAGAKAGIGLDAVAPVINSMKNPLVTKTITLSCGKLTTGVTVKPWTGIFMLRNLKSPETYFQAAFRVQSPWVV